MICFAQIAFFFPVNSAKLVNIQTYNKILMQKKEIGKFCVTDLSLVFDRFSW